MVPEERRKTGDGAVSGIPYLVFRQRRVRPLNTEYFPLHRMPPKCGAKGQYTNNPRPTIFRCGTGPQSRLSELW
jgi:hypothetical protein